MIQIGRLCKCFGMLAILGACGKTTESVESAVSQKTWWKEAIVYQLYPRSFKDTDGDGVGDINGIIEQLDYIKSLGVTAVWLNPIYTSPNADNGYDVSDYRGIMEEFGTMQDFDRLLYEMHQRGLKLIMDIVVNHSSDEHPWFLESRSSRQSPYRDYYHWWPVEKGTPPYRYSLFDPSGNAWKYDSITDAYYLHYFSDKQPDLNWANPKLRREVYDIMHFWAKKGVDGFRLDAFQFAAKDTSYPEFPKGFEADFITYYAMQDGLHDYLREMNEAVMSKYDVLSVSEGAGRNFEDAHNLVDADRHELNMAYAFEGVDLPKYGGYELDSMKAVFGRWDASFSKKGWLSIFLSNHDQARMVSRWGNDSPEYRSHSASLLNTFILTMRGTPYCYYGDELGMTNIDFDTIADYRDIAAISEYQKAVATGADLEEFMKRLNFTSRDNGRTPMQWDAMLGAGFSEGEPWLPVNENHRNVNVINQDTSQASVLQNFRILTRLRTENSAFVYGDYQLVELGQHQIYAYTRSLDQTRFLVVLNFGNNPVLPKIPTDLQLGKLVFDNYGNNDFEDLTLLPWQAKIYRLK